MNASWVADVKNYKNIYWGYYFSEYYVQIIQKLGNELEKRRDQKNINKKRMWLNVIINKIEKDML